MCGKCLQELAIEIGYKDRYGVLEMGDLPDLIHRYYYLRESRDLADALERLRMHLLEWDPSALSCLSMDVTLLRGLETLLLRGFSSPAYQRLLKNPDFRAAISKFCSRKHKQWFKAEAAAYGFSPLTLLCQEDIYLKEEGAALLDANKNMEKGCCALLKHYIEWWFESGPTPAPEGKQLYRRFEMLLPALCFSILRGSATPEGVDLLLEINRKESEILPLFEGNDLWLKRLAERQLLQRYGMSKQDDDDDDACEP